MKTIQSIPEGSKRRFGGDFAILLSKPLTPDTKLQNDLAKKQLKSYLRGETFTVSPNPFAGEDDPVKLHGILTPTIGVSEDTIEQKEHPGNRRQRRQHLNRARKHNNRKFCEKTGLRRNEKH